MWDVALADHELRPEEQLLIHSVTDIAGAAHKRVIEEQMRAARANRIAP